MKIFAFALFLLFSESSLALTLRDPLEWASCADNGYGDLSLDITPYPIKLVDGSSITVNVLYNLLKDITEDATITLKMVKKGIIPIPIPCIEVSENIFIGSCAYSLADLLGKWEELLCPNYVPEGQTCGLPLKPGKYGGEISATIPAIPPAIANIARGTIKIHVDVQTASGTVMCYNGELKVTNKA